MGYPNINDLEIYKMANEIAEEIYKLVSVWEKLHLYTIGNQLMRSVDSIAANISEGYGRHFYKENKQFCYYSRGSLFETKTWLFKAFKRELLTAGEFNLYEQKLDLLLKKLNAYIRYISNQIKR